MVEASNDAPYSKNSNTQPGYPTYEVLIDFRHLKLAVDERAAQRIMSMTQLIAATMDAQKSLYESLADWLSFLGVEIRAARTLGIGSENDSNGWEGSLDPDFEGWLHGDPLVTGNAAGRYCDDAPGFLTRNGLGSLEIGAADD